jgi:hypothetical protein
VKTACAETQGNDMCPPLDTRGGHEQASHDCRVEIPGRGDEAAGHAAHRSEALRQAACVGLSDRHHPAAHEDGHQRMPALVHPCGEQLERVEEELRPRRKADDQRERDRRPQPVSDRTPRRGDQGNRHAGSRWISKSTGIHWRQETPAHGPFPCTSGSRPGRRKHESRIRAPFMVVES